MRGATRMFALVGAAVLALVAAPAASAADPFYGMFTSNLGKSAAPLAAGLNAHAATGVGTLREHFFWDRIERSPGVFDFRETDALIAAAVARGMTVLPVLVNAPRFYSGAPDVPSEEAFPPRDPAAITNFAQQLARRYGSKGTYWGCLLPGLLCIRAYHPIKAWQVWNEPDIKSWWPGGPDPDAYTALLARTYQGLKAGDSKAEVVLGGLTFRAVDPGGFLEQIYNRGAAASFDTLALHPYAVNVGGVVTLLRRARAIAAAKGDGSVPIRATEYGFANAGAPLRPWVTTSDCQAALVAATTRELSARRAELGLIGINQFQWEDRSSDPNRSWPYHAGLVDVDGRAKPALAAFTDAVAGRAPAAGRRVADVCAAQHQG